MLTTVSVAELSTRWEGAARPTHFAGVCTVVAKLFHMVGECRAYFGEKDWQQVAVVARMVDDLSIPVAVVGCPVVREPDGLAMSSRNVRLAPAERAEAPVVQRALRIGAELVASGETDAAAVRAAMAQVIGSVPSAAIDYLEPVDPATLEPVDRTDRPVRLIAAVQIGSVRLLDNLAAGPGETAATPGGTP
jgi:pantoate--beta-alanine ligase